MSRVFIDDRWLKDDAQGRAPTAAMKRSLANAKDPLKASVPAEHRTSVYGRYARWRARWYVVDKSGRKVERSKTFRLLSDAEAFAAAMEDDVRRGRYRDPRDELRLFRDVADEWLASKLDVKASTLARYRRELRVYVNPMWGDKSLRELSVQDIQAWVGLLQEGGYPAELPHGRQSRKLSARSIRSIVRIVMGGVLDHAVDREYLRDNPIGKIITPKIVDDEEDMAFLSIDEVEDLADEAAKVKGDPQDALIVRWQAYTGMRIGETFALQVGDMDFRRRRARVSRTWTVDKTGSKGVLGTPKNGKPRWAAFPAFLLDDMKARCHGRAADDWVFTARRGGNLWVNTWRSRIWTPALRMAGMEDEGIRIHDLRHTYASLAIAAGCDVKTLQAQLGHASATITLDTYAKLWPERLDEVSDAINRLRAEAKK